MRSTDGPPPLPSRRSSVPCCSTPRSWRSSAPSPAPPQRQEALAANIANADTPGYQRVDVDFHGALAAAHGLLGRQLRARAHRASRPQVDARSAPRRPTATRSTSTTSRPSSPPTRSSSRPPCRSPRRASRSCARRWVSADEHVRRHGDLRERRSPRSACGWTSRPRTSPTPQTTKGADGQPYRRKEVVLQSVAAGRLRRAADRARWAPARASRPAASRSRRSTEDQTAGKMVYDPSHPDANAQGYVQMPNVDTVTEMVDLIDSAARL